MQHYPSLFCFQSYLREVNALIKVSTTFNIFHSLGILYHNKEERKKKSIMLPPPLLFLGFKNIAKDVVSNVQDVLQ